MCKLIGASMVGGVKLFLILQVIITAGKRRVEMEQTAKIPWNMATYATAA